MKNETEIVDSTEARDSFDYSYVRATARVALYDDLKSAPRITKVTPAPTNEFIENLTVTVYEQAKLAGGSIPYSMIREVSENFIHAQFVEIVVSILDNGNTIRFADQGPGIAEKEKAQKPGFSSAIEPMKDYIRGVGSGFPLVKDYLDDRKGVMTIEDNLTSGAVVTISLAHKQPENVTPIKEDAPVTPPIQTRNILPIPVLSEREKLFITVLYSEGNAGVTELSRITDTPMASAHNTLKKLQEAGLVKYGEGKKRTLTELGIQTAHTLSGI